METFFQFLMVLALCGTVLGVAFMVALSLPKSKLRCLVLQVTGWLFTALCGAYVISPIDLAPEIVLGPFGLIDDIGAVVAAIMSARTALQAGRESADLSKAERQ